jgi:hypothetical protein
VFVEAIPKGLPFGRWWTASTVFMKKASVEDVFFRFGGAKHREESDRHLVERAPNLIEDEKLV